MRTDTCRQYLIDWAEAYYLGTNPEITTISSIENHVSKGRFKSSSRPTPYFFVHTKEHPLPIWLAGQTKIKTYTFEVFQSRRKGDIQEGTTLDDVLRADRVALEAAFDNKSFNDYPIDGLRTVSCRLVDSDLTAQSEKNSEEQAAVSMVTFEIRETAADPTAVDLHAEHSLTIADHADFSLDAGDRTILLWVYLPIDGVSLTGDTDVLVKNSTVEFRFLVDFPTGNFLWRVVRSGGGTTSCAWATASLAGWHMIALVNDLAGAVVKISVDGGTFVSAAMATPPASGAAAIALGNADFFGRVDTMAWWSRALTQLEVTQLYASGRGLEYAQLDAGLLASLTRWWGFDLTLVDSVASSALVANYPVAYVGGRH